MSLKNLLNKQTVIGSLLIYGIKELVSFIRSRSKEAKRMKEIEEEAEESLKPLKAAKTGKETDEAIDKALNNF